MIHKINVIIYCLSTKTNISNTNELQNVELCSGNTVVSTKMAAALVENGNKQDN
jgi:hypothetical protein